MLMLRDIMTREVLTLSQELSVRDAMDVLTRHHISGAPVVANGRVIGVVSLTDLAELAASVPGVPAERPDLAEWGEADSPVDWIEGEEPPAAFFAELWDDSGADVVARMAESGGPEWNALEEHTVGEAMNRNMVTLASDTPVEHAAAMMQRADIHRVLVMDDGDLVGLVSTKDVSNAVADRRITNRVYVFGSAADNRGPS